MDTSAFFIDTARARFIAALGILASRSQKVRIHGELSSWESFISNFFHHERLKKVGVRVGVCAGFYFLFTKRLTKRIVKSATLSSFILAIKARLTV